MKKIYTLLLAALLLAVPVIASAATATVYVDRRSAIALFTYNSQTKDYNPVILQNEGDTPNEVTFNAETESTWNIEGQIYQIVSNGEVIAVNVNEPDGYDITGMQDGDVLKFITEAPAAASIINISYGQYGKEAVNTIFGMTVDQIENDKISTTEGRDLLVSFKPGYTVKSVKYNGKAMQYIIASDCYFATTVAGNATLAIDVTPIANPTISLTVDNPEAVSVSLGTSEYGDGTPVEVLSSLPMDIQVASETPVLKVAVNKGYEVVSAKYTDAAGTEKNMAYLQSNKVYYVNVIDNDVKSVSITTQQKAGDMVNAVIYCNDVADLTYYFIRTADREFPIHSDGRSDLLKDGYQTFSMYADQNPIRLCLEFPTLPENNVYLNNELLSALEVDSSDNSLWGDFTLPNNSVLKIYTQGVPALYNVNFVLDGVDAEDINVVADLIQTVDASAAYSCLTGTLVEISSDKVISVTVGDEAIEAQDGKYSLTVNADSVVTIAGENGIAQMIANPMQGKVYNLQGIEVKSDNLPAGLYIINGKKQLINK